MVWRSRLRQGENPRDKFITHRKEYIGIEVSEDVIEQCFNFSYDMAFGEGGHRDHRSGGQTRRTKLGIFWDTFRGKIAECAAYEYFKQRGINVTSPDFSVMGLGEWDSVDMRVNGREVSIKSTKDIGQLLLLEVADWDADGNYIPNATTNGVTNYDYFLLVRTKIEVPKNYVGGELLLTYEEFLEIVMRENPCITAELTGVLSHDDFVNQIMKYKYIIRQGDKLNGWMEMDASNYYVQCAELEPVEVIWEEY